MNEITFTVNGVEHHVGSDVSPNTSLNNYLRSNLNLRGTQSMCHEGGCGICVVVVRSVDHATNEEQFISVNSCLVSVLSCHNWDIITVEGVGNRKDGYHEIQKRLAGFNGTQCGFCSPGWVMSMYSMFGNGKPSLTMKEIENSFAGNICRCTGYRPILDAFKSFATDADSKLLEKVADIEDLNICTKTGNICTKTCADYDHDNGWCIINMERSLKTVDAPKDIIKIDLKNHKWYKVFTVADIFKVFKDEGTDSYRLIAGNTGRGIYKIDDFPKILIDVASIDEIRGHTIDVNLELGAGMTLSEMMTLFANLSESEENFSYLTKFNKHMNLVAHYPVRNIGTIGGNLSLKHFNHEFQSDLFLLFEAVGATMVIYSDNKPKEIALPEYLSTDMTAKVIYKIKLPPLSNDYLFESFKIMPRAQNAHAEVNAAFMFKCDPSHQHVQSASIVYGGISAAFIHATATEKTLIGRNLFTDETLQMALHSLENEVNPEPSPPEPSIKFRKTLALNLFYKGILSLCPSDKINKRFKSGGEVYDRPVSQATQQFDTNESLWPLGKPIPKVEALVQCSGEGAYANDIPTMHNEVFAAFVLAPTFGGTLGTIDATEALKLEGVIACYTAKDIPGVNNFMSGLGATEEVLCGGEVLYHGQPVAIIVADSEGLANRAAKLVKVSVGTPKSKKPALTIKSVLDSKDKDSRVVKNTTQEPTDKGNNINKVITGTFELQGQFHYTMETQTSVVIPIEDGLDVYSSTQWMDLTQTAIHLVLGLPMHKINVHVRRLGGGYGAKISRASLIAPACALVATLQNRPCRMILPLETNMMAVGKRHPLFANYEVGVDSEGEIQYLKNTFYQDNGCNHNESAAPTTFLTFANSYETKRWFIEANSVRTDKPANTWCRSPSSTEGIAMIEHIMDKIAGTLKKDHIDVRLRNMKQNNPLPKLIQTLKHDADYDNRLANVKIFNDANRWKKRAIRLIPMTYKFDFFGNWSAVVNVFQTDGTVCVTHGGIEMGQGINTKVAQVCAHILNIPLEKVVVKPSNTLSTPNSMVTGGSVGSESVCFATMKACKELLERLEAAKATLENPTWEDIVKKAHAMGIDLQTSQMFYPPHEDSIKSYDIYGVTIIEVELDILTGNHQVLRVDILEDTGQSMSPTIDVGQIEGAFIMGLGYWTSESLHYDPNTGELLTNRTWNYKPPGAKDIPLDMRVYFMRNADNPVGVLRSKATGEPPLCMSVVVTHALHEALRTAVNENLQTDTWFDIDLPFTNENIVLASQPKIENYKLQ